MITFKDIEKKCLYINISLPKLSKFIHNYNMPFFTFLHLRNRFQFDHLNLEFLVECSYLFKVFGDYRMRCGATVFMSYFFNCV